MYEQLLSEISAFTLLILTESPRLPVLPHLHISNLGQLVTFTMTSWVQHNTFLLFTSSMAHCKLDWKITRHLIFLTQYFQKTDPNIEMSG